MVTVTFSNADYPPKDSHDDKFKKLSPSQRYDFLLRELSCGFYGKFDLDEFILARCQMVERETKFKHQNYMKEIIKEMTEFFALNPNSDQFVKNIAITDLPPQMLKNFISEHSKKFDCKNHVYWTNHYQTNIFRKT